MPTKTIRKSIIMDRFLVFIATANRTATIKITVAEKGSFKIKKWSDNSTLAPTRRKSMTPRRLHCQLLTSITTEAKARTWEMMNGVNMRGVYEKTREHIILVFLEERKKRPGSKSYVISNTSETRHLERKIEKERRWEIYHSMFA